MKRLTVFHLSVIFFTFMLFFVGCAEQQKSTSTPIFSNEGLTEKDKTAKTYTIKKGDTLWSISKRYGISVNALISTNRIADSRDLKIGQVIVIPAATTHDTSKRISAAIDTSRAVSPRGFIWPVKGHLVSRYHEIRNGIKISGIYIQPHYEQNILAAKQGTVEAVSDLGDNIHVIVIQHDRGIRSMYGCNCTLLINEGSYVKRGQPIARLFPLRNNILPEFNFKIYVKDKPVNPVSYLP